LRALGIAVDFAATAPSLAGPALVAASHLLVPVADLRRVVEAGGVLTSAAGERLPAAVWSGTGDLAAALGEAGPCVPAGPVASVVKDEASRRAAEAALWRSLTSSSDGWVDRRVNRPLGRLLSRVLIHTRVSPNQVSVASILIGIASGWCFARGDVGAAVVAAWLLQLSAVVDCVDGDVARVLFKESPLGRWLDLAGDQLVHLAVFAGIPLGLHRQGVPANWLLLGASCVVGVILAFAVVARGLSLPRERRSSRLEGFIEATTNRDFSVLLLVLAPLQRLEWFVWAAAIGLHLFWMTALALQLRPDRPPTGPGRETP
jgi:phosphatidylglycerophosphate synthase